jgi:hypothetical protein
VITSTEIPSQCALAQIKDDLARFDVGPDLQDSVRRHYEHLETLTTSLKKLGVDNKVIDQHVLEIFNKYRMELLRNIERITQV